MNGVIERISSRMHEHNLFFSQKPIVIGGMAMEYYGMRKSGADIDLVISNNDYIDLSTKYQENRKDLYGDLGVVIAEFEIWRSIALLGYDFLSNNAIEERDLLIVSLDRLLFMRVCAMDVDKYRKDLVLMKEYYYKMFQNDEFVLNAKKHEISYRKNNGAVFSGNYCDD